MGGGWGDGRMEKQKRQQARESRRQRSAARQQQRNGTNAGVPPGSVNGRSREKWAAERGEGESSSEESEGEREAYVARRAEIVGAVRGVFRDASEEFGRLESMRDRLEEWKKKFPETYRAAYVSLTAPTLFAPYVRLELLTWDPLHAKADFRDMEWYKLLFNYGVPEEGEEEEGEADPSDPDADLVPTLVKKVALPLLCQYLEEGWDPLGGRATAKAVAGAEEVGVYVAGDGEEGMGLLVEIVERRIEEAVKKAQVGCQVALCPSKGLCRGGMRHTRLRPSCFPPTPHPRSLGGCQLSSLWSPPAASSAPTGLVRP